MAPRPKGRGSVFWAKYEVLSAKLERDDGTEVPGSCDRSAFCASNRLVWSAGHLLLQ